MNRRLSTLLHDFWTDESGVAMPEYALIIALVSLGLLVVLVVFRDAIGSVFERVADFLQTELEAARSA